MTTPVTMSDEETLTTACCAPLSALNKPIEVSELRHVKHPFPSYLMQLIPISSHSYAMTPTFFFPEIESCTNKRRQVR